MTKSRDEMPRLALCCSTVVVGAVAAYVAWLAVEKIDDGQTGLGLVVAFCALCFFALSVTPWLASRDRRPWTVERLDGERLSFPDEDSAKRHAFYQALHSDRPAQILREGRRYILRAASAD